MPQIKDFIRCPSARLSLSGQLSGIPRSRLPICARNGWIQRSKWREKKYIYRNNTALSLDGNIFSPFSEGWRQRVSFKLHRSGHVYLQKEIITLSNNNQDNCNYLWVQPPFSDTDVLVSKLNINRQYAKEGGSFLLLFSLVYCVFIQDSVHLQTCLQYKVL